MNRLPALILALAMLPLAGCIGGEDAPVETASTGDASAQAAAPNANAVAASPPPAVANGGPATAEPRITPVNWDGSTGTGFCAPAGPSSCSGTSMGGNRFTLIQVSGNMTGEVTLTWDATTPLAQTLDFAVMVATACGSSCYSSEGADGWALASGESPLVISFDFTSDEGKVLAFSVRQPMLPTPSPVYGYVSIDQPFHVEGIVTSTP